MILELLVIHFLRCPCYSSYDQLSEQYRSLESKSVENTGSLSNQRHGEEMLAKDESIKLLEDIIAQKTAAIEEYETKYLAKDDSIHLLQDLITQKSAAIEECEARYLAKTLE
jgi:cytochrome c biogenesis protein ResB